jgi:hypothetical protein
VPIVLTASAMIGHATSTTTSLEKATHAFAAIAAVAATATTARPISRRRSPASGATLPASAMRSRVTHVPAGRSGLP